MGSGKSRVARELALRLDVPMIDLDERITERSGRSPAQWIVEDGEAAFRSVESEMLREVLHNDEAKVIALGGGAWIHAANRALVEQYNCVSVWLDVPFETCWTRIETSDEDRPLGRTPTQALDLYQQRRPVYQLASVHIEMREENLEDLVSRILSVLTSSS